MKKSTILILGFLGLALIDSLIGFIFPIDFSFIEHSIVPHFCFIGTLIYVYDKEGFTRLLIGSLVGLMLDMLFTMTFPVDVFLFGMASYAIGFFAKWMQQSKMKYLIVLMFAFLYDGIPYVWSRMVNLDYATFGLWFLKFEMFTIGLNFATVLFLNYIKEVMSRFFLIRQHRKKK